MIITLISFSLIVIGIILINISNYLWKRKHDTYDFLVPSGMCTIFIGIIMSAVMCVVIITTHIDSQQKIAEYQYEYESLCKRLEIVNSEYEDVSKSNIIKEVTEWNIEVSKLKYGASNPWSSWLYSKEVADSLKYIEKEKYLE